MKENRIKLLHIQCFTEMPTATKKMIDKIFRKTKSRKMIENIAVRAFVAVTLLFQLTKWRTKLKLKLSHYQL